MKFVLSYCLVFLLWSFMAMGQGVASPFEWKAESKKIGERQYEIIFTASTSSSYILYAPNQQLDAFETVELLFDDSAIVLQAMIDSGDHVTFKNPHFNNAVTRGYKKTTSWKAVVLFKGMVPPNLPGQLFYTYGDEEALYPSTVFSFLVKLQGGTKTAMSPIKRSAIDIHKPLRDCGDEETSSKGLLAIFLLGLGGGLIALLTPCVFPMIPLTVSFFTKQTASRKKALQTSVIYASFIFVIYVVLSIPFHLMRQDAEVLNRFSTNAWLNIAFFFIFVFFAFSFFGFYEISLPARLVNLFNPKAGSEHIAGILFMALTLAIVSFSCTGPILGSLLAGAISNDGGAMQLSFGMGGFGAGLALPFALFSIFPQWMKSLPKSGGWLTTIKIILGFAELALALKFLSNADMVKQWGLIKREVFIGIWILICGAAILYQLGFIRFPHESVRTYSRARNVFTFLLILFTIYLVPGVFNTPFSGLTLISGFPPPVCYSVYMQPVNCVNSVKPLNDYEEALAVAKKQNKPILIDFTGWACVNCRRMEEKVWTDPQVRELMNKRFVVVSLYVDERTKLPINVQGEYMMPDSSKKMIMTVGEKWASFQSVNFGAVSQPQYAIVDTQERVMTKTKGYTPDVGEFVEWLKCGLGK